ncbi:hypothetical protein JWZ98_11470 [Methylomonas sp. EFPC1]|uniref:hypothetical protein n=1 Tax=unclassified Methylomonas TaxID=2608980 RepID=UPI00051BCA51|nr:MULTISPECIES: hypothetical protein [unclassified Methylomonas]PKD40847.1 hypothetical protein CWO84_08225 [Methylomonas sp. Kb3]QBC27460.1 hypothetical protein U737_11430 [Methylomonas sp. LW13]QSB03493.1 hypothetical protein JWZ98_11470 [Methylomonas sp. EFPC1]
MKHTLLIAALLPTLFANPAQAGSLANGSWQPSGCGAVPESPTIDAGNIDAYNKSIAAINAWQQKSRDYFECLIKEANTDNGIIADHANQAQAKYRETVEKIGAQAEAAKKKLDKE